MSQLADHVCTNTGDRRRDGLVTRSALAEQTRAGAPGPQLQQLEAEYVIQCLRQQRSLRRAHAACQSAFLPSGFQLCD
jgi:hypothetical protein